MKIIRANIGNTNERKVTEKGIAMVTRLEMRRNAKQIQTKTQKRTYDK